MKYEENKELFTKEYISKLHSNSESELLKIKEIKEFFIEMGITNQDQIKRIFKREGPNHLKYPGIEEYQEILQFDNKIVKDVFSTILKYKEEINKIKTLKAEDGEISPVLWLELLVPIVTNKKGQLSTKKIEDLVDFRISLTRNLIKKLDDDWIKRMRAEYS